MKTFSEAEVAEFVKSERRATHDSRRIKAADIIAQLQAREKVLRETVRAIELCVDGLEMKQFTPKPAEKAALDRIKSHCRAALGNGE